jgi:hypothetical protein
MFIKTFIFLLLAFSFQLQADLPPTIADPAALIGNEIARLDTLIQATEQSLEGQKKLRTLIVEYQKLQDQYLKNTKDNELLFKLVKSAYRVLVSIKENHLIHNFDPEFIDELTVLSQPASKRGIPKP